MRIALWKLSDVKPYAGNPRLNEGAVTAVATSIREFGFRQPIVVDRHGVIVVGHTRYRAAQQLGLERVPVHVARDLSPAQLKAYRIADNKTSDLSDWDFDLLPLELNDLKQADFDLSLFAAMHAKQGAHQVIVVGPLFHSRLNGGPRLSRGWWGAE